MKKSAITIFIIAISTSFLFSCNDNAKKEKEFDDLMQQVIDVHDEVMPKIGNIGSLIKKLEAKVDTTAASAPYIKAQEDLKGSYDFMMEWMQDFSKKFPYNEEITADDKEKFEAKMKTLKEEEIEVNTLKEQINSSIDNAKRLLGES
ncbi:hypothetical protein [Aquimarina pacifica]|uniref:hypothetical protein n=1 Tax=Aquimarina pacifica TaxID=1296415 RepID=UPI0004726069|nr:hypothetical protein [Aquimarina pacifica]